MHINKQRPLSRAIKGCKSTQQGAAETNTHKGRRDRQTNHKTVNKQPYAHTHTHTNWTCSRHSRHAALQVLLLL